MEQHPRRQSLREYSPQQFSRHARLNSKENRLTATLSFHAKLNIWFRSYTKLQRQNYPSYKLPVTGQTDWLKWIYCMATPFTGLHMPNLLIFLPQYKDMNIITGVNLHTHTHTQHCWHVEETEYRWNVRQNWKPHWNCTAVWLYYRVCDCYT
jgi:hypothetical protein